MFSRKKIAALSGLIGGLAVASTGIAHAQAAGDPASCTRSLLGDVTCVQRIAGKGPRGGVIPHQETCLPVQPVSLPAAMGPGATRLGPQVTCSPASPGAPQGTDVERKLLGLFP